MPIATVTSKGQITIPLEVRRALGLDVGARVEFTPRADGGFDFTPLTGSVADLAGALAHVGPVVSLEEMDAAIAVGATGSLRP